MVAKRNVVDQAVGDDDRIAQTDVDRTGRNGGRNRSAARKHRHLTGDAGTLQKAAVDGIKRLGERIREDRSDTYHGRGRLRPRRSRDERGCGDAPREFERAAAAGMTQ